MADAVLDHPSISRLHAAVCYEGLTGAWRVVDLGSAHGTFVDGRAVDKVRASAGGGNGPLGCPFLAGADACAEVGGQCSFHLNDVLGALYVFTCHASFGSCSGSSSGDHGVFCRIVSLTNFCLQSAPYCCDIMLCRSRRLVQSVSSQLPIAAP